MKFLARAFLLLLIAVPLLAAGAAWLSLQDTPLVAREARLTHEDVEKARRMIERHDPRGAPAGVARTVRVGERELELMLNYAASRFARGAASVSLRPGAMSLQASVEIPHSPIGPYLNVDALLREGETLPRFDRLRIGALPVPAAVADYGLRLALRRLAATERGALAADVVRGVRIAEGRLELSYVWSGAIEARARASLLPAAEQARLRVYHDRLVAAAADAPAKVSLAALMPPLFATVAERGAGGSAMAESRAALVVLAFYAGGGELAAIAPAASQWPQPARRTVTLSGRTDFPKHYLISAAIAAAAGSPLADAVGLHKEVADARGGSGFSFNDIAADRAGARLGELASASQARALELARAISKGVRESDFMPDAADLPEFMSQQEFDRRFGGVDGPGYRKMMAAIEARIASRPLLR